MERDARSFLWDVREAADAIFAFVDGIDQANYAASPLIHSAVERKFEIIGEALNQLAKSDPALAERIPEIGKIIAFRNILIHGYAAIDHARVWDVVVVSLPALRETVQRLLDELNAR